MKLNFLKKVAAALTASMLTLSMVAPAMATEATTTATTKVFIHKIKMENLNGWPKAQNNDGTYPGVTRPGETTLTYDGTKINNIAGYFGDTATELAGVYFKYYELTKDQYEAVSTAPDNDSEASIQAIFTGRGWGAAPTPTEIGPTPNNDTGLPVTLNYPVGGESYYWFIELPRNLAGGQTLAGAAAVPFGITLPLYNKNGVAFNNTNNPLHVYPKNTVTDKPEVTKKIDTNKAQVGGAYPYNIGDEVPYTITTVVKKNSNYATLRWSDSMTEGLTMLEDGLTVTFKINNPDTEPNQEQPLEKGPDHDYTFVIDTDDSGDKRGFTLQFTEDGLSKVNKKAHNVTITIKYKAELNEKAIRAITESNDVTFNYGNNPSEGNSPKPSKPRGDDNKLKVKKLVDGEVPTDTNLTIRVTLYNAQTNVAVDTDPVKELNQGNGWQAEWTGLDKDTEYYVVETVEDGTGFTPTYSVDGDGNFVINNKKTDNPPPISPEKPKVVTFGKRFIKVEKGNDNKKLAGAKFVVGRTVQDGATTKNEYLVLKTEAEQAGNLNIYNTKETAYQDALNATYPGGDTEREAAVRQAKTERDEAYEALKLKWKWVEEVAAAPPNAATPPTNAFTFTTGEDGKFAIVGLESGSYFLKETAAPVGYVLNTNNIAFTIVDKDSWTDATGIDEHTKVPNSKVTIPQTGGIGTILFTLAGATIMGGAVFAMKKRDEDEEE